MNADQILDPLQLDKELRQQIDEAQEMQKEQEKQEKVVQSRQRVAAWMQQKEA